MLVGSAMGAGATTDKQWACNHGYFGVILTGTFETTTLTIEASKDNGVNWFTYYADAADGTPNAQQFTVTHVPSSSALYERLIVGYGLRFRGTTNSTGTTPSINVEIVGENVHFY